MRRRSRLGPLQRSRLATATLLPVALIAATGSWMRTTDGDCHRPGLGVLVSVLAYLMGVAAAVAKARAAAILMVFSPRSVRSVAVLSLIVGLVALLLGCVVASGSAGEQRSVVQIVGGESAIALGVSLGLAGLLTVFWTSGLDYLGERIDARTHEDW